MGNSAVYVKAVQNINNKTTVSVIAASKSWIIQPTVTQIPALQWVRCKAMDLKERWRLERKMKAWPESTNWVISTHTK